MSFRLFVHVSTNLRRLVEGGGVAHDSPNTPFWISLASPEFRRLGEAATPEDPIRVLLAEPVLSGGWLGGVRWFEVEARHTFALSHADFLMWLEDEPKIKSQYIVDGCSQELVRLRLSKLKVPKQTISAPDTGPYVFVASESTIEILREGEATGLRLIPVEVRGPGGDHWIISGERLPRSGAHICIRRNGESNMALDGRVALAYRYCELVNHPDVALTSESYGDGLGRLVVSKKFWFIYRQAALRGLTFRPVIDADSEVYGALLAHWEDLRRNRSVAFSPRAADSVGTAF